MRTVYGFLILLLCGCGTVRQGTSPDGPAVMGGLCYYESVEGKLIVDTVIDDLSPNWEGELGKLAPLVVALPCICFALVDYFGLTPAADVFLLPWSIVN